MAIQAAFRLYAVKVTNATSSVIIPALNSGQLTNEVTVEKEILAGFRYPTYARMLAKSQPFTFESRSIAAVINAMGGPSGVCLSPSQGAELYFGKYDCSDLVDDGTGPGQHLKYTIRGGAMFPTQLTANHGEDATMSLQITGQFDGVNRPVVKSHVLRSDLIALNIAGSGQSDRFGMYSAVVNGHTLNGKRSISIDFGVQYSTQGADDESFDSYSSIDGSTPVTTIGGVNPEWFPDNPAPVATLPTTETKIPLEGIKIGHDGGTPKKGQVIITLAKRDTALTTNQHIRIWTQGMSYFSTIVAGSGRDLATSELKIEGIQIDDGLPLVMVTDATIP